MHVYTQLPNQACTWLLISSFCLRNTCRQTWENDTHILIVIRGAPPPVGSHRTRRDDGGSVKSSNVDPFLTHTWHLVTYHSCQNKCFSSLRGAAGDGMAALKSEGHYVFAVNFLSNPSNLHSNLCTGSVQSSCVNRGWSQTASLWRHPALEADPGEERPLDFIAELWFRSDDPAQCALLLSGYDWECARSF